MKGETTRPTSSRSGPASIARESDSHSSNSPADLRSQGLRFAMENRNCVMESPILVSRTSARSKLNWSVRLPLATLSKRAAGTKG